MPEKKVVPVKKPVAVAATGGLGLPPTKKTPTFNLDEYLMLVYGREKIGKTTLFSTWPDALFLSCEPGTKGMSIFEFNADAGGVTDWKLFLQAVKLLEAEKKRFKTVVIDTVDRAYEMALDYACAKYGIEYPGKDAEGKEDFGKSWKAVKEEFTSAIHRIIRTGRGVCFTSHVKEVTIKTRSGEKFDRIVPSMSNQARGVVEALVDMFFYAEYAKDASGKTVRLLITEGDETIWAGSRKTLGRMPRFLPLEEDKGYSVILSAFRGEHKGLDPTTFYSTKATTETAKTFMRKAQLAKKA